MEPRTVLLSFLLLDVTLARAEAPPPAARAVLDPAIQDLGTLAVGEDVVSTITVHNRGDAALTLEKVSPSEGLSLVDAPQQVAPGAEGVFRVKVDTWHLMGPRELSLTAATNDPQQPALTIPLKVVVRPFIAIDPGFARYIVVQGAPEGTIGQTLWDPEGGDFGVVSVVSPYPYLHVTSRDARPNERQAGTTARQWHIESTLDTDAPVGPLAAFIVVKTDHPRQKEVRIPVSGFVRPMVAVTPPEANFGDIDRHKTPYITLFVKNFAEEMVAVESASCDVPGLETSLEPLEPGRSYNVKVTTSALAKEGTFAGTVRLKTNSPKVPFVDVPVKGRVLPDATP
jgi:hypothetical protein